MITIDLDRQITDEENSDPRFLRLLAAEAREKAEYLIGFAKNAEKRAKGKELVKESWDLAHDLQENFDPKKLEAFVQKQRERLANNNSNQ